MDIRIVEPGRITATWTSATVELSGKTIVQCTFFVACATLIAVLYLGAWLLRKVERSRSSDKLLHVATVLAALLIARYFAEATILYG
ncbi:MAG: hypothetical protein JSS56_16565 [Proteobacteria bacterium]|nr:hypothetical protein [Pseudomonadota bacterium]